MAKEREMWADVRDQFAGMHARRIENAIALGTPDVNYSHGWVELKCLSDWPVKSTTPIKIRHFTKEQRVFLTNRCMAGGRAYLLLRVLPNDWLLFNGFKAAEIIGTATKDDLYGAALAAWEHVPPHYSLKRLLCPAD